MNTYKLIKLEPGYIIVSEENIKDVKLHIGKYHYEKGVAINKFPIYLTDLSECKLIIASTFIDELPDIDFNNLEEKFGIVDVEKLSNEFSETDIGHNFDLKLGYITGFNKCLELLGK